MPNRKHTLTKIQLAEMKETFGSPKILRNLNELKTHNKSYEALSALCNQIQVAVHNKNMELANKLVEKTFVKLEKMNIRRSISANEFKSYLNNKSKILKFAKGISSIAGKIAEAMKYEGLITKTFTAVKNLNELYKAKKKKQFIAKGSVLKQDREKLKDAYKKMKVLMSCADIVGEFAPAGISNYIEFNVKFFKNAEQAVNLVDKHADKWEKEKGPDNLNKVMGKHAKEHQAINSVTFKHPKKLDINQAMDFQWGRPSPGGKRRK